MQNNEIRPVKAGQRPSATRENQITAVVNAVRYASGDGKYIAMELSPRGLTARWVGPPIRYTAMVPVKITGTSTAGDGWYHWTEQRWDEDTDAWVNGPNTSATEGPAYEMNGSTTIEAGTFVRLSYAATAGGLSIWTFQVGGGTTGVFPIRCIVDGGSNGDATTTPSYTYTVTDINGTAIGSGVALARTRTAGLITAYTVSYGFGMGFYDGEGTFKLWDAGERPQTTGTCVT